MRIGVILIFVLGLLTFPVLSFAECSNQGYTIIYVNGILTSQTEALRDLETLQTKLSKRLNGEGITAYAGYNPSHVDGLGDEVDSIAQTFGAPLSNYDLDTILDQIAPEITTKKVLLVGHSQGTFYTNEMYDYLVKNGVSPQSIAVYNLATPADHVEGGGTYLTSANDKAINYIRELDAEAGAPSPLPANILIPIPVSETNDPWGGHYFQSDYLDGAANTIISDINTALNKLSAGESSANSSSCFTPPSPTISYDIQKEMFVVADPTALGIDTSSKTAAATVDSAFAATASAIVLANAAANNAIHSAVSTAFFSIFPKPDAQNAGTAFSVEKALYGSSLSEQDYEDLLGNGGDTSVSSPSQGQVTEAQSADAPPQQQTQTNPQEQTPPAQSPHIPPTSQPIAQQIQQLTPSVISPGFGGGGEVIPQVASGDEASSSNTDMEESDDQSQQRIESNDVETQQGSSTSDQLPENDTQIPPTLATTSPDDGASVATTSIIQASCGASSINAQGYFFDSYDDPEYSPEDYLIYHFKNISQYSDGRPFKLGWVFYDNNCNPEGPELNFDFHQLALPADVTDWSVRFTSMTHFDVWDDQNDDIVASFDIPALPLYSSVKFAGTVDGGASTFDSRILKINKTAMPPVFDSNLPTPAPCQDISAHGYYFDPSYEHAEYVDGLLRVHLHLLTPYNDGILFRADVLTMGTDCSPDIPHYLSLPLETQITPFIQYYSFRMSDPTHWVLWDDENDIQIQCSGCEGAIPDGTDYVSFYGSIDADSTQLRTTPYPPTQM